MKNFLFAVYAILGSLNGILFYVTVRLMGFPGIVTDLFTGFLFSIVAILALIFTIVFTIKATKSAIN